MAEFHEIGSSQFTDVTPTGEEKIQISASQRTTLQNIANLAPERGLNKLSSLIFKLIHGNSVTEEMLVSQSILRSAKLSHLQVHKMQLGVPVLSCLVMPLNTIV